MRAIVVGAGPAGAAAAYELARGGAQVQLVEKSTWPRPKTCGDGISPHGVAELRDFGFPVGEHPRLDRALVTTPSETAFRGSFPNRAPHGTVVERSVLDAALVEAAIAAGAMFSPSTEVRSLEPESPGATATLASPAGERRERFDVAFIAEGATGSLARRLGFPPHRSRLVALRGYANAVRTLAPEYGIFYDRALSPGYGWIFPVDERRANVGIVVDERTLARRGGTMRALLNGWIARSLVCRERLGEAPALTDVRGGIIPSGRARRTKVPFFLIGDAAGVADPFTAEGVYESIASGRSAARAVLNEPDTRAAARRYERELRRFDRNERAARALRATFTWSIEPFARRAATHPALASRLNTDVFFLKRSFTKFVVDLLVASAAR